jgi:hypothetical protein
MHSDKKSDQLKAAVDSTTDSASSDNKSRKQHQERKTSPIKSTGARRDRLIKEATQTIHSPSCAKTTRLQRDRRRSTTHFQKKRGLRIKPPASQSDETIPPPQHVDTGALKGTYCRPHQLPAPSEQPWTVRNQSRKRKPPTMWRSAPVSTATDRRSVLGTVRIYNAQTKTRRVYPVILNRHHELHEGTNSNNQASNRKRRSPTSIN